MSNIVPSIIDNNPSDDKLPSNMIAKSLQNVCRIFGPFRHFMSHFVNVLVLVFFITYNAVFKAIYTK